MESTVAVPLEVIEEKSRLETRVLKVSDQEHRFQFLIIDSAEKWDEAQKTTGIYRMPIIGTNQVIAFPMHGPSLKQWEDIEIKFIVPEWSEDWEAPVDFKAQKMNAIAERRAAILECCLQKEIPGKSAHEKIGFLNDRCPGEVDSLFQYIENSLCNWSDGPTPQLLTDYLRLSQLASPARVIEFNNFEDWKKANETQYVFQMQRPTDDYIIEIPLRGLSRQQKETIQEETKDSSPPHVPVMLNNGSHDRTRSRPNYQDPSWLKRSRTKMQHRTVLYFDACMPFIIPGSNIQEKYDWISRRLVGDITKVKEFIESELMSFGSRYNFFLKQ